MSKGIYAKPLTERTLLFAQNIRMFVRKLPYKKMMADDCEQLVRSAGSVGANYLEAQEALSKKDFIHRLRICRKEAREAEYWLKLLVPQLDESYSMKLKEFLQEAHELILIFTASIKKAEIIIA